MFDVVDDCGHVSLGDADNAVRHVLGNQTVVIPDDADHRNVDVGKDIGWRAKDRNPTHHENQYGHYYEGVRPTQRQSNNPHLEPLCSPTFRTDLAIAPFVPERFCFLTTQTPSGTSTLRASTTIFYGPMAKSRRLRLRCVNGMTPTSRERSSGILTAVSNRLRGNVVDCSHVSGAFWACDPKLLHFGNQSSAL